MSEPIPAIQSAYLNLKTAIADSESAMCEWEVCQWPSAVMWIENAQSQLASAKAKIEAHAARITPQPPTP